MRIRLAVLVVPWVVLAGCGPDFEYPEARPPEKATLEQGLVGYSCTARSDTGYRNGTPFSIRVVTVDGEPVELETADAFLTMAKAAESSGVTLRINSGFRTMAEQQYFYNCYLTGNCNNGNLAAPPGYSNHQSGHALDLNTASSGVYSWLSSHGASHGFSHTVPSENWHWEWWGGGNPTPFCSCTPTTEVCDGVDNDCDGSVDEDEVCEQLALARGPVRYAPPRTTDVNGDGRADVCGRSKDGLRCALGASAGAVTTSNPVLVALSNAAGFDDPVYLSTLRMGDIDGDGRADACARDKNGLSCWLSSASPLSTRIEGPRWTDANGWTRTQYFSTIRLLDLDGDGRDDVCARAARGLICHLSTGTGFGPQLNGPAWSNDNGYDSAKYYGTLRTGDIDGDGRDDVCIRAAAGMRCALSTGVGFGSTFAGPEWSNAKGWSNPLYWGSIQLVDVNGDGRADLCARHSTALVCHFSTGTGFGPSVTVDALTDASGWTAARANQTLRTGDVTGDGVSDLCIRSFSRVLCYAWSGASFTRFNGPAWSDGNGWGVEQHYETIRLGDVDGDGRADVCGRAAAGWACALSTGSGFGSATVSVVYANANGWGARPYFDSLLFGSSPVRGGALGPPPESEPVEADDGEVNGADGGATFEPEPELGDASGGGLELTPLDMETLEPVAGGCGAVPGVGPFLVLVLWGIGGRRGEKRRGREWFRR